MALIQGFSHLMVEVSDLDRSETFYQEVFGLDPVGRDLVNDGKRNALLAMNTRQRVLLVEVDHPIVPFRPNSTSIHHAWLLTPEQFDRTEERLKRMGFDTNDSRKDFRAVGERSIDVFDPDGHRYQIQAYGPEAKAVMKEEVGEVACGTIADYPVGAVKAFMKGRFFLVRLDGGFHAVSRWCTHMNGLLAWQQEHWQFYCPMHGATYNRKGECTSLTRDLPPLRTHPVSIAADGSITVRPGEVIERDGFDPTQLACPPAAKAPVA